MEGVKGDGMELKMISTAVVVLSEGNNPKLLNPDFLKRNKVVSGDWKVKDVLVTPPFAQVSYENAVQFTVEINKLQIQVNRPEAVDWVNALPAMASSYLELLPHVTYRAVGINFVFGTMQFPDNPFKRLLREGAWFEHEGGLTGAAVELQYRSALPHMNVKIAVQERMDSIAGKVEHLVFTVNFHHDFDPDDCDGRASFIGSIGPLQLRFLEFAEKFPF